MPFKPGQSGNPHGRPKGITSIRTQEAIDLLTAYKLNPLKEQILHAKMVKKELVACEDVDVRLDYHKVYAIILEDLTKRAFPTLKAVEHTGNVTHVHTTEELAQMSDVELQAYVITYRAELEAASDGT